MNKIRQYDSSFDIKLAAIEYAKHAGVSKASRELEILRSSFYSMKNKYRYLYKMIYR